jgi:hypothetical protein
MRTLRSVRTYIYAHLKERRDSLPERLFVRRQMLQVHFFFNIAHLKERRDSLSERLFVRRHMLQVHFLRGVAAMTRECVRMRPLE